jgi:hypothetical protein
MKAKAKIFREIAYVEVKDLPQEQQALLKHFKDADYIKILIDNKVVGPCMQYKQYETWYNTFRLPKLKEEATMQSRPIEELLVNRA